jgi:hypothetical protein
MLITQDAEAYDRSKNISPYKPLLDYYKWLVSNYTQYIVTSQGIYEDDYTQWYSYKSR